MRLHVNTTKPASLDGITVITLEAGQTYDVPDQVASSFVRAGWGTTDAEAPAPENKAVTKAPAKKGRAPRV